jgi:hypothetical protein
MNNDQKVSYLEHQLPYEFIMIRHTNKRIHSDQSRLDWNAYYEYFCGHARNLYHFFINEDGKNAKMSSFVSDLTIKKSDDTKGIFQKLNNQVFHLGWSRPEHDLEAVWKRWRNGLDDHGLM